MPSLEWIGKKAVVNHHREVPYRLLHCDKSKSVGDPDAGNLLVQADNLEALKALLPYYAGTINCIYIDPPYNTGNEGWIYNDNVNSPEIKAWLGSVVGKEAEDLSRHDKWLCMMYPRLRLLHEFLAEDGILLCSINDFELHHLKSLLSSIFQANNFIACFIWINEGNIDNQSKIKTNHEYVVAFGRREERFAPGAIIDPNIDQGSKLLNDKIANTIVKNGPKNPISELVLPRGFPANFQEGVIEPNNTPNVWPKFDAPIRVRDGKVEQEARIRSGWSSKNLFDLFVAANFHDLIDRRGQRTRFYLTKSGAVYVEKDRSENQSHILTALAGMGTVQEAAAQLKDMGVTFSYPKPLRLISYLLTAACGDADATFMDSFAGSGTTGHAVLELNRRDNGTRKFICVELDPDICEKVTAPRLAAAIKGFGDNPGTGGGYRYCTLGEPLFDGDGNLSPSVAFSDLAAHVFFCETGSPLPHRADGSSPLIGTFQGRAIYLLFSSSSVGFADTRAGNVLTTTSLKDLLASPPGFSGHRVVYAEGCTVPEDRLTAADVTFKQMPYQIEGL
ncbi:MAG: site-specific DNA-methyltransferase [Gemmatimonas sp.]